LAVGLVGDDPGSQIYLRNKVKASAELGIAGQSLTPPATITTEELLAIVDGLNRRPDIDGILVQLPLPPQVDNRRLLALEDGQVSFAWKDYRDKQQPQKVMTVSAEEFIRRFLQHSLPPGFQRIRYYGFLANCHRAEKLALCRRLLATPCSSLLPQPADCCAYHAALIAGNPRLCPRCGVGTLISIQTLWPCHGPAPLRMDSS
jgi:hypothetical protein